MAPVGSRYDGSPGVRRAGTWAIVGLAVLVVLTFVGSRVFPHAVVVALSWPGYLWLAVMFYLVVGLLLLEIPAFAGRRAIRSRAAAAALRNTALVAGGPATPQPTRRKMASSRRLFLARTVAITAGVVAVGTVGSGVRTAMGPSQLRRVQIPLAKLPRGADATTIALVSDIHLGPLNGYSHTRRIVDMINTLDADIVAVVGDLVDGSVEELGHAASALRELRSRAGAYFVTGNHEYYSGYQDWIAEVASLGVRPLRNERVELPGFDLAGVNDATGGAYDDGPDVAAALAGRDEKRAVIMLAHQPIQAGDAASHGVDLQLSGHTHGGQMVPFNLIVKATGQPVVSGLGEVDGMPVYVTDGAGFSGSARPCRRAARHHTGRATHPLRADTRGRAPHEPRMRQDALRAPANRPALDRGSTYSFEVLQGVQPRTRTGQSGVVRAAQGHRAARYGRLHPSRLV